MGRLKDDLPGGPPGPSGSGKGSQGSQVSQTGLAGVLREDALAGRVVLVTGASRGIGRACALAFARAGAAMSLVARSADALAEVAEEVRALGRPALACPGDVTRLEDIRGALDRTEAELGPLDVLLNNAGIHLERPFMEWEDEDITSVVMVNFVGAVRWARLAGERMAARGRGVILNMGSFFADRPARGAAVYAGTKAGLVGFTRGLALELGPYGVRVVTLQPGYIATEINAWVRKDPELNRRLMRRIPLGRFGEPEEVGFMAVFLASDAAAYFSGTGVLMDGGASNALL